MKVIEVYAVSFFVRNYQKISVNYLFVFCSDLSESSEESEEIERSYGLLMLERLTGSQDGRVDHVLQVCTLTFLHRWQNERVGRVDRKYFLSIHFSL